MPWVLVSVWHAIIAISIAPYVNYSGWSETVAWKNFPISSYVYYANGLIQHTSTLADRQSQWNAWHDTNSLLYVDNWQIVRCDCAQFDWLSHSKPQGALSPPAMPQSGRSTRPAINCWTSSTLRSSPWSELSRHSAWTDGQDLRIMHSSSFNIIPLLSPLTVCIYMFKFP